MMEHSPSALERVPGRVVPMFPLPNVWLFPAVILPLHVFEQRYRQMVEDCLDGPGRIVLGTIRAGHEPDASGAPDAPGTPPIYPVAGLGEIGRHERLPDGRFNLLLVGLQRVVVREAPSDRLYRKVEIQPAPEQPIPAARHGRRAGREYPRRRQDPAARACREDARRRGDRGDPAARARVLRA
jgi:Lon protease-like protein